MYANHSNRREALLVRKRKRNSLSGSNLLLSNRSSALDSLKNQKNKSLPQPKHLFRSLNNLNRDWVQKEHNDATTDETDSIRSSVTGVLKKVGKFTMEKAYQAIDTIFSSEKQPDTFEGGKKRKIDTSRENPFNSTHDNKSPMRQKKLKSSKKQLLESELKGNLSPEKKDINFVKSPIDWNLKETLEKAKEEENKNKNYGTKFYGNKKRYSKANVESQYLRSVYQGQYKSPSPRSNTNSKKPQPSVSILSVLNDLIKHFKSGSSEDFVILKEIQLVPPQTPSKFSLKFDSTDLTFNEDFQLYQKLLNQRRISSEKISKEIKEARKPKSKLIKPLTEKQENEVINIWKSKGKDNQVLVDAFNVEVTVLDLKTLADKRWLNDVVIELFLKTLGNDKIYAFNSFMFTTMQSKGYQGVQKWMKRSKVQISKLDLILCPINVHQTHWVLGAINLKQKKIIYLDSLAQSTNHFSLTALDLLEDFVVGETKKQGVPQLGKGFVKEHIIDCPQQQNGYDCGVFTLLNSLYLSKNAELTYQPSEAKTFRRVIAYTILSLAYR